MTLQLQVRMVTPAQKEKYIPFRLEKMEGNDDKNKSHLKRWWQTLVMMGRKRPFLSYGG